MKKSFGSNGLEPRSPFKQAKLNPPVPGKAVLGGAKAFAKDYNANFPQQRANAIAASLANKATGGITMDNSLVGLPGIGTLAKAGIRKAASKTAGAWTGRKTGAIADATVQFHGLVSGK